MLSRTIGWCRKTRLEFKQSKPRRSTRWAVSHCLICAHAEAVRILLLHRLDFHSSLFHYYCLSERVATALL